MSESTDAVLQLFASVVLLASLFSISGMLFELILLARGSRLIRRASDAIGRPEYNKVKTDLDRWKRFYRSQENVSLVVFVLVPYAVIAAFSIGYLVYGILIA